MAGGNGDKSASPDADRPGPEYGMQSFETSPFVLPPRQERSRAALARIIQAASEVLVSRGAEGFSMAEIAAAAGMPVGNIYRRFKGKEDIVQAIKLDATARLEAAIRDQLGSQAYRDVRHLVSSYARAMASAFEKDAALHRVLFSYPTVTPDLSAIGTAGRMRIYEQYKASLMPLLSHLPARRRETMVRVSFEITAMAFVAKARADDPFFEPLSWNTMAREFGDAAVLYLTPVVAQN